VSQYRLALFGTPQFTIARGDAVPTGRRARAILCYLALARDRKASRERLCALFWGDRGAVQARGSLRQTLLELRAALPEGAYPLLADREFVTLDGDIVTDLDAAEAAATPAALVDALAAIGAEPALDGLHFGEAFDDWRAGVLPVLDRRLRKAVLVALDAAAAAADHAAARAIADAWAVRDPLDEAVAARGITAEIALGDRSAAERRYRDLAQQLQTELGTNPGAALVAALEAKPPPALASLPRSAPAATPAPVPPASPAVSGSLPAASRFRGTRWLRTVTIALLLMAAIGATALLRSRAPAAGPEQVVAVLPFEAAGSASDGLFATGLAERLVDILAADSRLKVMGRATSLKLAAEPAGSRYAWKKLGVTRLLRATVRSVADRSKVELRVRLIDSRSGETTWKRSFDIPEAQLGSVASQLAGEIAAELLGTRGSAPSATVDDSIDPQAYRQVVEARQHIHSREGSRLIEAWELAGQAIDLAPNWAEAHATRSIAASLMQNYTDMPIEPLAAGASAAAARAIALDPKLPAAQEALSFVLEGVEPDKAILAASRAVVLQPGNADARRRLAWLLRGDGQIRPAVAELEAAVTIDPLWHLPYLDLGISFAQTNEPGRLIAWQTRYADLSPPSGERDLVLANTLFDTGRAGDAIPIAARLMRTEPRLTYAALSWIDSMTALFAGDAVPDDVQALNSLPAMAELVGGDLGGAADLAASQGPGVWDDAEAAVVLGHGLLATDQPDRLLRLYRTRFAPPEKYLKARPSTLAFNRHPGLYVAAALAAAGDRAGAATVRRKVVTDIARLRKFGLAVPQSSVTTAAIAVMEGRQEQALDRLEAGMAAQWPAVCHGPVWLGTDPLFHGVRDNPRFQSLLGRCRQRLDTQRKSAGLGVLAKL